MEKSLQVKIRQCLLEQKESKTLHPYKQREKKFISTSHEWVTGKQLLQKADTINQQMPPVPPPCLSFYI